ncbi:MAG: hypothetical protein VZR64_00075 [Eubacterium sp.]|nr:hypothetical protein [Eubacterium sp.]
MKKNHHYPIIVYPSKKWTDIDVPIGLPKGTICVSVETLRRSAAAAKKQRDKIFHQQQQQRRHHHRTWRQYWRSDNGKFFKAILVSILAILTVLFLGEEIRRVRQEWWYAHHSVEEIIEERN